MESIRFYILIIIISSFGSIYWAIHTTKTTEKFVINNKLQPRYWERKFKHLLLKVKSGFAPKGKWYNADKNLSTSTESPSVYWTFFTRNKTLLIRSDRYGYLVHNKKTNDLEYKSNWWNTNFGAEEFQIIDMPNDVIGLRNKAGMVCFNNDKLFVSADARTIKNYKATFEFFLFD